MGSHSVASQVLPSRAANIGLLLHVGENNELDQEQMPNAPLVDLLDTCTHIPVHFEAPTDEDFGQVGRSLRGDRARQSPFALHFQLARVRHP